MASRSAPSPTPASAAHPDASPSRRSPAAVAVATAPSRIGPTASQVLGSEDAPSWPGCAAARPAETASARTTAVARAAT
ncbi:hypothetical protein [Halorarum salinum]|uniref:Uncharacterized protein n=1 Tax=Halorarum salinum TaxID=2743089 RepID=A0A7D5QDU5_9EURY|nr:hypothetical protein [Halobaculum salinum]QLG62381.1 hypothetical protein HUG12_11825 [Halobaculum salinum]